MGNRQQLREQVYARCGFDSADGMVTPAKVNDALNEALHFVETVAEWWWLMATETLVTVAGTDTVTPSTSSQRTKALSFADGVGRLRQIDVLELDERDPTGTDRPQVYAEHGASLVLWPTPDAVYSLTHRYVTVEPDLTGETDEPLLPVGFQSALVDYASFLMLTRSHDEERATARFESYQAWESRMLDNKRRSTRPRTPRIRDGAWVT